MLRSLPFVFLLRAEALPVVYTGSMDVTPIAPDAARALLEAAELPTDDLADPAIRMFGAFDGGALVGVVGVQSCDRMGLLRSLAVAPAMRERGIAAMLCERVIELARAEQLAAVWLLTTGAKDYFARHGFIAVARETAPAEIRTTAQFSSLCPSSATVMRRDL